MIINATPVGMFPHTSHSPLANYPFHSNQIVFDLVYNPVETQLLKRARLQGAYCISGLDMFIGQGIKQIELWLNQSITTPQQIAVIKQLLEKTQREELELV